MGAAVPHARLPKQARMDLWDVIVGIRPGARILVRGTPDIEHTVREILKSNCSVCVSRGTLRCRADVNGWADCLGDEGERFIILYVAASQSYAEGLRQADENGNDEAFGKLLGYPECCVRHVAEHGVIAMRLAAAKFSDENGVFDPLVWPPAVLADRPLLPHFPCNRFCDLSRRFALRRLSLLKHADQVVYSEYLAALSWWYYQSANGAIICGDPSSAGIRRLMDDASARLYRPMSVGVHE